MAITSTDIRGLRRCISGKVRDVYDLGDELLIIATDRISAFDVIMPTGIPDKGRVLTQLSLFWFDLTKDVVENHLITADTDEILARLASLGVEDVESLREVLDGRLNPGRVFDLELPMTEVAEAYAAMDERRAIKVLLRP